MNANDIWNMKLALEQAEKAYKIGEVPIGCVVTNVKGEVVSATHNLKEKNKDATHHAEILAISEASLKNGDWRLNGHTLYVTLEPCPMCLYAILQARFSRVVFGAYDFKAGSISLGYKFFNDKRFNHQFLVTGGMLHFNCSKILSDFFKQRRGEHLKGS